VIRFSSSSWFVLFLSFSARYRYSIYFCLLCCGRECPGWWAVGANSRVSHLFTCSFFPSSHVFS
jgi:hypothetical protein